MSLQKYIQKLPLDKKEHFVLGIIINFPLAFFGFMIGAGLGNERLGVNIGLLTAIIFHAFIEVWQLVTKKGKFEILDFLAGSCTAIQILFIYNLTVE